MVRRVGRIRLCKIQRFLNPSYFAEHIRYQLISEVHYLMAIENNGTKWSSTMNCQTFTRAAIKNLGFDFPSDVVVISDCVPSMVDLYLAGRYITSAIKKETINKKHYVYI